MITSLTRMLVMVTLMLMPLGACLAAEGNLLKNGIFTAGPDGAPEGWTAAGDPKTVEQELRSVPDGTGGQMAQLTCTRCDLRNASSHAMLAQMGVPLTKGRMYELSMDIRAKDIAAGTVSIAISNTQTWTNCGLSGETPVSDSWTTFRRPFTATQDVTTNSRLQIWFHEPGTLFVRNAKLVEYNAGAVEFTQLAPAGTSRNLVPNGSFELGPCYWSSLGKSIGWGNLDHLHGTIESNEGQHFLRIPMGAGRSPMKYFDYFEASARADTSPLASNVGWIPVERGQVYTISCRMRSSVAGTPAVIGVVEEDPGKGQRQQRKSIELTSEWARYSFSFKPQSGYLFVTVGPNLPTDRELDVDVDDVQLERSDSASDYVTHNEVEFAVAASDDGIIYAGDRANLLIYLSNANAQPRTAEISFEVTDYEDRPISLPPVSVEIAGKSSVMREVTLPADWRGYFHVKASAKVGDASQLADVRLAIVPKQRSADTVCGINHAFSTQRLIGLASRAGVSWYRDWSLKWQHMEPRPGEMHWEIADQQIDRVLKEHRSVLPLLPPFPSAEWNSEAPATMPAGSAGTRIRQAWAPKDPQDLGRFIGAAVDRYKDKVHVWEFLNEPLFTDYSLPEDDANRYKARKYKASDYVELLSIASAAMKKADPNCRVMGGLAGGPEMNLTRDMLQAGVLKHVDILNLHCYPGIQAPETYFRWMDQLGKQMDSNGGRKPIWVTEFSYYGADLLPRKPFIAGPGNWAEARLLANERQCADYTARYFLIMLSHGVEKIFIHSGASGAVNNDNFECALFAYGGVPRKLMPTLAVLNDLLGSAPKPAGDRRLGETGYAVAFEAANDAIVAVWATQKADVELPELAGAKWISAVGQELSGRPEQLTTSPVYIVLPKGTAAETLAKL